MKLYFIDLWRGHKRMNCTMAFKNLTNARKKMSNNIENLREDGYVFEIDNPKDSSSFEIETLMTVGFKSKQSGERCKFVLHEYVTMD